MHGRIGRLALAAVSAWFISNSAASTAPEWIFGTYEPPFNCEWHEDDERWSCPPGSNDHVSLKRQSGGRIEVSVFIENPRNTNACQLHGVGVWRNDRVVVNTKGTLGPCTLEVIVRPQSVILRDVGQKCVLSYCGGNVWFEGEELPKSTRQ